MYRKFGFTWAWERPCVPRLNKRLHHLAGCLTDCTKGEKEEILFFVQFVLRIGLWDKEKSGKVSKQAATYQ